jgi:signal transduction histidine kinase
MHLIDAAQSRKQLAITVHVELDQDLPEDVHIALYRIVQESINNMVQHSDATEGQIELTSKSGQLNLRIQDNGRGFKTDEPSTGLGLSVMRERAAVIEAALEVTSTSNVGTEIVLKWTPHL